MNDAHTVLFMRRGSAKLEDLRRALDELGVKEGEDFAITHGRNVQQLLDPDGDLLGPDAEEGTDPLEPTPDANQLGHFSRNSETSRKAALDNYPRSGTQRAKILAALVMAEQKGHVGATRDQLSRGLGMPDSSVDARVGELIAGEFARETEQTRKTQHGSDATVVVATDKGHEWVQETGELVQKVGAGGGDAEGQ